MTTDPEEGERQVEAILSKERIKIGDTVNLKAVGHFGKPMTVVGLEHYGDIAVCEYKSLHRDIFPTRSLIRVENVIET
jgi:hypothetical protein